MSAEIGPEIFIANSTLAWEISDWDIWVPTEEGGRERIYIQ